MAVAVLTISGFCDKHLNLSWRKTSMWIKFLILMKFKRSYLCIQGDMKLVNERVRAVKIIILYQNTTK
jgi:hypothetical protein